MRALIFAALVVVWPSVAAAQVALTGGTVHTGTGEVIEGGVVVIGADGKIGAVGKNVATPSNAKTIDVTGKVVTPGFIDVASQLGLVEIWLVSWSSDGDAGALDHERDQNRAAFRAADGFNPMAVAIPMARAGGVTSVVTMPWGGLVSGQAAYAELRGDFGHATILDGYVGMRVTLGARGGAAVGGSRASAILKLREAFDDARFWKANRGKFDEGRSRDLQQSRLDAAALAEVLDSDKPLFVDVRRASDILAVLGLAREFGLRIVLLHADEGWLVAKEIAAAGVPVVVYPTANLPVTFDELGQRGDNAALLQKAGVTVVLSSFDAHYVGNLRILAGNAVRDGLDHEQAVVAVTKNAAIAAGLGGSVGTLEAQKAGNVVVWSGDPFEISTRVESVFIGGREVSTRTRQDELFERYRTLPRRAAPADPPTVPAEGVPTGGDDVEQDD